MPRPLDYMRTKASLFLRKEGQSLDSGWGVAMHLHEVAHDARLASREKRRGMDCGPETSDMKEG